MEVSCNCLSFRGVYVMATTVMIQYINLNPLHCEVLNWRGLFEGKRFQLYWSCLHFENYQACIKYFNKEIVVLLRG